MDRPSHVFSANLVDLDGEAALALYGELDMNTAPELERVLDQLIQNGPAEIVLDLSDLSFIDSSGIATVIAAQRRLGIEGRRLIVQSPRPMVLKVFEITDLLSFLNVRIDTSGR